MLEVFCVKQKTAYEMRISDWSSDVCSSDLADQHPFAIPVRKLVKACPFDAAIGPREICPNVRQGDDVAAQIEAATYMIDADMETLKLAIIYHRGNVIGICCFSETNGSPVGVKRTIALKQTGRASCRESRCK